MMCNILVLLLHLVIPTAASPRIIKGAAISCPNSDASLYTTPSGVSYIIECGVNHAGNDLGWSYTGNFEDCLALCAKDSNCAFVTFVAGNGFCYMKSTLPPNSPADASVWSARLTPALPSSALVCPGSHGSTWVSNSKVFMVECYTDRNGNDIGAVGSDSLNSCIRSCSTTDGCVAATYIPGAGWCWLKRSRGIPYDGNDGVAGLRLIESGAQIGTPIRYTDSQWRGFAGVKYWFAFGDSYSTVNFNPQGTQPSLNNPIGNPPAPPFHTTAAGPNYLIFLAETYNKSTVLMYDFAGSGAILPDPEILGLSPGFIHEGTRQVQFDWMENYASTLAVPWTAHDSMFSFWFGINDVVDMVGLSAETIDTYMNGDIAAYRAQLDFLYLRGARNFLVINVPPTDRTPGWGFRSAADRQQLSVLIPRYNTALLKMVNDFGQYYSDATIFHYDAWTTFSAIISDPKSRAGTAGLNTTGTWCDSYVGTTNMTACDRTCYFGCVDEYMWQDYIHPTWVPHTVVAAEIVSLLR